jgi:hypothetical protein
VNRAPPPLASHLAAVGVALSLVAAMASAPVALAADPVAPANPPARPPAKAPPAAPDEAAVDDELIEFLGSIGDTTEEGDWLDFLSNTDIDQVAKRGAKTPARDR